MAEFYLLILFILFSSYFSGIDIAIYCINRVRLQYKVDRGIRSAKIIKRLLEDPQALICTVLIGNNIVNYLAAATFTYIISKNMSQANSELVATLICWFLQRLYRRLFVRERRTHFFTPHRQVSNFFHNYSFL